MIEDRSGGTGETEESQDAPGYESSLFVDSHTLTSPEAGKAEGTAEGIDVTTIDANEPHAIDDQTIGDQAIDQLRAATTAADARTVDPRTDTLSPEHAAEIRRLHEVTIDAQQRAGRVLATPRARRRLHDASTEESDALHMLGFATFDEFAAAYAALPTVEARHDDDEETIARIAEILAEIGVDPSADPLEAAREFLATHEEELIDAVYVAPPVTSPTMSWAHPPIEEFPIEQFDATFDAERVVDEAGSTMETEEEGTPTLVEAASAIEIAAARAEAMSAAFAEAEADGAAEAEATMAEDVADRPGVPVQPEVPVLPEAAEHPEVADRDEEIVDRWISAEARAERMHAEVDRAQAELVALLARSAELESTVVERVTERDSAHADLDEARARVIELEQSIARSDLEHGERDAALASSRNRIGELEDVAADREQAYARSERERAEALETIVTLEADLVAQALDLEQARESVAQLETQIANAAAQLDTAREELDTTRNDVIGLRTELEATRRSVTTLDEHAQAVEAELAEARRKAESPDTRHELDAARQELAAARNEAGELEMLRTETAAILARDRAELEQLHRSLTTTRDLTAAARSELSAARNAFEAAQAKLEAAERARAAITVDAAELLARAEADAANILERAGRDAEAIRQEARLENPDVRGDNPNSRSEQEAIAKLAEHVDRLERKLTKRLRKLAEMTQGKAVAKKGSSAKSGWNHTDTAANLIAAAEQEAMEIRRAAREDRERFREELAGLVSRLAPAAGDDYY